MPGLGNGGGCRYKRQRRSRTLQERGQRAVTARQAQTAAARSDGEDFLAY